jgi:hypothetical protein
VAADGPRYIAGRSDVRAGTPISASRVRLWAQSGSREWTMHQHEDLWLVSEVDASGERAYLAPQMETFPFTIE